MDVDGNGSIDMRIEGEEDEDHDIKIPQLHQCIEEKDLEELYLIFKNAKEQKFTRPEFADVLAKYNIYFEEEDFENLFLKINTSRDNEVDWDEFISYLIYGFQINDPNNQKAALDLPIANNPVIYRSHHRHPILKVDFCPMVLPDRGLNNYQGSHVTTSKDGQVNYWSLEWELQRSGKSKNPFLKAATMIIQSVSMADLRLVCVASSERDLRFYDSSANNYVLRLMINNMPTVVTAMTYKFYPSILLDGRLVTGDGVGNIRIFEINNELRRCFTIDVIQVSFRDLLAGKFKFIKCVEYLNIHMDTIRQISFFDSINSFASCSECTSLSIAQQTRVPGVMVVDVIRNNKILIKNAGGITCFDYDHTSLMFVTGGPDCNLRLWSLSAPQIPSAVLPGHHAGLIFIFIQDQGKKIYSLDKKRVCKVWDAPEQTLLQTFIGFVTAMYDSKYLTCFYNDLTRELTMAGSQIAIVKCCPLLRFDLTDGNTHSRPVSVVLYNKLFKVIITCGLDSYIIVWDPWKNKRLNLIQMSHTRHLYGEILRVQITAATFDSKHQLLLTGARDGTLKIWNFNNGFCMRNLSIEDNCEVTSVFWVGDRILAVGWNRHVTEFVDTEEETDYSGGKKWDVCHAEDILCSASRAPQTLVTTSYSGEIVLWKFETGQPYGRYKTNAPTERLKIIYQGNKFRIQDSDIPDASKSPKFSIHRRASSRRGTLLMNMYSKRKISQILMPETLRAFQFLSVQAVIFLESRPMNVEYGTLFAALSNGRVQVWSHHHLGGGYITDFNAIHMAGDSVVALATDVENLYLFTATALGYIKTWVMEDYCVPNADDTKVSLPLMRTIFPFLIRDIFDGRAKRTVKSQPKPMLVNSYKAHAQSITSLIYIDRTKILISSSTDKSVRLWTLNGFYIGTLGSPIPRQDISPKEPIDESFQLRVPPDIKRDASFTTLKVLKDGAIHPVLAKKPEQKQEDTEEHKMLGLKKCIFGHTLKKPILGKNFKLPERCRPHFQPILDTSVACVPIYRHIELVPLVEEGKPPILMPKLIVRKPTPHK